MKSLDRLQNSCNTTTHSHIETLHGHLMSNNDKCFVCGLPQKIPPSGTPCHQDRSGSRHWYTHTQRDRSYSTHYGHRHGRHVNQSQSHHHSHCGRSSSFRREHCVPYPDFTAAHTTLWPMDASIAIYAMTHPTGIVTPHPTLTTSLADIIHATIPQTRASLTPATPTTLHRKYSQGKPKKPKDLQPQ